MESKTQGEVNSKSNSSGNPRIVTMDSIRSSERNHRRQAYFAGGSEHSGQQILGGNSRRNVPGHESGEALASAFRRASSGNDPSESRLSYYQNSSPYFFRGTGYRLGDSELPIPNLESVESMDQENPTQITLTLWEDGYNIDNGFLQSYDQPQCAELMRNIDRGELPADMLPFERPGPVHLSVVDKRTQKYKQSLKVFGGEGYKLGNTTLSISPNQHLNEEQADRQGEEGLSGNMSDEVTPASDIVMERGAEDSDNFVADDLVEDEDDKETNGNPIFMPNRRSADKKFEGQGQVVESQANTSSATRLTQNVNLQLPVPIDTDFSNQNESKNTLKIRLPDGNTMQITVNASCTIAQLRAHIRQCFPCLNGVDFSLTHTFPRRTIDDDEMANSTEINNAVLVLQV